jgi:hypothetical protein
MSKRTKIMPAILMSMSNLHHDSSPFSSLSSLMPDWNQVAIPFILLLIVMTGLTLGFFFLACFYFRRKKRFNAYVYRKLPMT